MKTFKNTAFPGKRLCGDGHENSSIWCCWIKKTCN